MIEYRKKRATVDGVYVDTLAISRVSMCMSSVCSPNTSS